MKNEKITFNKENERVFKRIFKKDDLEKILYLFSGRRDLHAEEVDYNITEKIFNYTVYNYPLSQELLELHLSGIKSLMYYPIDDSLMTNIIVLYVNYFNKSSFNFDGLNFHLGLNSYGRFWELIEKLYSYGIKISIEFFNSDYLRLIIFLKDRIHFLKSKDLAEKLMFFFYKNGCILKIEPDYKTIVKFIDWKELPMPLPLGIIPKTNGLLRLFINHKTLTFYEDQLSYLCKLNHFTENYLFSKLNEELVVSNREISRENDLLFSSSKGRLKKLQEKCKVIDFIISKTEAGIYLSEEEKKILYYTLSFLDSDFEILRSILRRCINFNEKTFNKQILNLYPRPISCPKIRELLPNIVNALDCNCIFDKKDLELGRYPSPILHINPLLVPTLDERYTSKFSTPKELAQKLLSIIQDIKSTERFKNIIESELKKSLKQSNQRRVKVENTIFYLTNNDELKIENL